MTCPRPPRWSCLQDCGLRGPSGRAAQAGVEGGRGTVSETADQGQVLSTFKKTTSPGPGSPSLAFLHFLKKHLLGSSEGTSRGRDERTDPHLPYSIPKLFSPVRLRLRCGKGLLRIHSCSGAHELCTGARSIRQHPVREESKTPAAGRQLFLRGDASFQGPPWGRC